MPVDFRVFGDIKQRYLPFVLAPTKFGTSIVLISRDENNKIILDKNGKQIIDYDNEDNRILLFSFRNKDTSIDDSISRCNINIIPESYKNIFNEDIANLLLYDYSNSSINHKITINEILNNIPVIEIREFLPDTKLELFLNFFNEVLDYVMEKVNNLFSFDKNDAVSENKEKSFSFSFKSIADFGKDIKDGILDLIKKCWNYLAPNDTEINNYTETSFYVTTDDAKNKISIFKKNNINDVFNMYYSENINNKLERILMHDFPKFMYYKLLSVTNSNVYVIPNNLNDKLLYSSNGTGGWENGGISITQEVGKIPLIGDIVSKLLKGPLGIFDNLRISYMPFWKSEKGQDAHPNIKIEFELINDTVDNALHNFLFVNTIVPNNKIVLYGMFLHSPCLYDVKIGGYDRLFACSGKFEVKHKGMLRIPSEEFFNKIYKHINYIIVDRNTFLKGLITNDLIRIPDTYEVTMEFNSLLPATFNNYMFTYSTNISIVDNINSLNNHENGPMEKLLKDGIQGMNTILSSSIAAKKESENNNNKDLKQKAKNIEALPDITLAGE